MTPQFIGQGMNAGIRDADNLSWKLAAILKHGASEAILDSYETERKPHATAMIQLSVFNKSLVSVANPVRAKARDLGLTTALKVPGLGAWIRQAGMKPRPRFKKDQYLGMPREGLLTGVEGTLPPQPEVRTYDGKVIRLDDALGAGWAVIGIGVDPRAALGDDAATWASVDATFATVFPTGTRPQGSIGDGRRKAGLVDVEDTTGQLGRWLRRAGLCQGSLLVLRPDKYVFGVAQANDPSAVTRALVEQLGLGS